MLGAFHSYNINYTFQENVKLEEERHKKKKRENDSCGKLMQFISSLSPSSYVIMQPTFKLLYYAVIGGERETVEILDEEKF